MGLCLILTFLLHFLFTIVNTEATCPLVCTCEDTLLSRLPISSVFLKSKHKEPKEENRTSYQSRNEVMDEADEQLLDVKVTEENLKSATCVLDPTNNLPLFLSLPVDLQVLSILQGPGTANITLDKTYFEHFQQLIVLDIHGFQHGSGILRLRNDALKSLQHLKYLNLQYVHLLGDPKVGNQPAPVSEYQAREISNQLSNDIGTESNIIPEAIQLIPENVVDIVPYNIYKKEQERAGLSSFAGLKSLKFLRAFHCNIKEVNWEMFDGLKKLEYLSLEGNEIPFLHDFSFYGTPNLKHLILSHNNLLSIQSIALAGLLLLETLDLSYNNITHLSEFSLPPFPQLNIADFHHNPLEIILPHTFNVMNNTEQLYLGGQSAQLNLSPQSFLGLDRVLIMSLRNVFLPMLEREYLEGMPNLKQLKMEGIVSKLSFDAFVDVPKLEELILRHCSITKISMDAFIGLNELIYLDLSHNELETLPPSLFDQQNSLKEIILHHNKLTTLPQDLFIHTQAKLIRLDKNPWHCSCAMSDWQPSQINKIKVKVTDNSLCQTRYDKGSKCKVQHKYQYMYEQSVGPRCSLPARFSGWSVFHLLRKHLRCDKSLHNPAKHIDKKIYSKKLINNTTISLNTTEPIIPMDSSITTQSSLQNKSSTVHPIIQSTTETSEDHSENNELTVMESNTNYTNMWSERDRQKYRLLQEKEERILRQFNSTLGEIGASEGHRMNLDQNIPTKVNKTSTTKKKWQMKMEDTMRRLNTIPTKK